MGRRARIDAGRGPIDVVVGADGVAADRLGRRYEPSSVTWLPPMVGTVIGLALNYADHKTELAHELVSTQTPDHPILFIKNPSSLVGHRHEVVRPAGVQYMHYEGELVAVIGRSARGIRRSDAMEYIGGYSIANDFTARDFVENFYRPPVKAKGFDTFGPVGPWIVDAGDVPDPHDVGIRTYVNGAVCQEGSTRDMIFGIPTIIEYISSFSTLQPGDAILTGTPAGILPVVPGDEVVVEIEGIGRLENRIVAEAAAL